MKKIFIAFGLLALSFTSCEKDDCLCNEMLQYLIEQEQHKDSTDVKQDSIMFVGSSWEHYGYNSRDWLHILNDSVYEYRVVFENDKYVEEYSLRGTYQKKDNEIEFAPYEDKYNVQQFYIGYIKEDVLYFPSSKNNYEITFELVK